MSRVGHWELNKSGGSFTAPTTFVDQSDSGNNGTSANAPTFTSGTRGSASAMTFNGTTDKVTIGNTGETVKSVSFWVNLDDNTTRDIIDFDGGTHVISADGSGDIVATGFASPTIYINNNSADPAITASVWTNIIVTTETGFTASNLVIGTETTWLDGDMMNFKIYDAVLTDKERYMLYTDEREILLPSKSGLVGFWTLRDKTLLSAQVFADRGTGMNNGTSANVPSFTTGPDGGSNYAMTFNGTTDYVDISALDNYPNGKGYLTLATWIKFSTSQNAKNIHGWWWSEENTLRIDNNKVRFTINNAFFALSDAVLNDNTWHHVVGTYDKDVGSDEVKLYVDSILQSTTGTTTNTITSTSKYNIGSINDSGAGTWNFDGNICNVRIYDRTLTSTEISTIYTHEGP